MRAERILPVSAQTHGTDGHAALPDLAYQLLLLFARPIQTRKTRVRFVDADLQPVEAGLRGAFQHPAEAKTGGHGLFIKS